MATSPSSKHWQLTSPNSVPMAIRLNKALFTLFTLFSIGHLLATLPGCFHTALLCVHQRVFFFLQPVLMNRVQLEHTHPLHQQLLGLLLYRAGESKPLFIRDVALTCLFVPKFSIHVTTWAINTRNLEGKQRTDQLTYTAPHP